MKIKTPDLPTVASIKPANYNPRTITKPALEALGHAMREFGDLGGVVLNVRTGNLVGGHQRVKHLDPSWRIVKGKRDGGKVIDPFLGSGTTLIAAEQTGRTCYGMEIDPCYVDVICERWSKLTRGKIKRIK